ncbi:hypothetical protein V6N12_053997 [Hibiscus sabdariffa]|uniref:Uncharacterized protein n=1 Tax=Hibiscus sabdariffa TaxID=183260 RepID=A0ABR2D973_9ROSI
MIQVANQQGAYLAKCFNRMEECEKNPDGPPKFRGTGRHRFHPLGILLLLSFLLFPIHGFENDQVTVSQ